MKKEEFDSLSSSQQRAVRNARTLRTSTQIGLLFGFFGAIAQKETNPLRIALISMSTGASFRIVTSYICPVRVEDILSEDK